MSIVNSALVIGGGFSGTSAAIQLRKIGVAVDLVEIDPGWRSYGAGITLNGATLRAFRCVGILPEIIARGSCSDRVVIYTADGHELGDLQTPRLAGADVPGGGGIMRPVLAQILAEATRRSGTRVRLGCHPLEISQSDAAVEVSFSDGTRGSYDLVIAADGAKSGTRELLFPGAARLSYTGQGVWRAVVPRPKEVLHASFYMGARLKAGVTPVSDTAMYLFITEDRPDNTYVREEDLLPQLRRLLDHFSAPVPVYVRSVLSTGSQIVFRPLEWLLLPQPWYRGRVLVIGDAAHASTPHLAAGAGMGVEDAVVLAEELQRAASLPPALAAFQQRRWPRCRLVVENSVRLGQLEQIQGSELEHGELMRRSGMALAAPF